MTGDWPLRFVSILLFKILALSSAAQAEGPFSSDHYELFRALSPGSPLPRGCNSLQPQHFANIKQTIVVGPKDALLRSPDQVPEFSPQMTNTDFKKLAGLLAPKRLNDDTWRLPPELSQDRINELPESIRDHYLVLRDFSQRYRVSLFSAEDVRRALSIIDMNPLHYESVDEDEDDAGSFSGLLIADSDADQPMLVHEKMGVDMLLPLTRNQIEQRLLLSLKRKHQVSASENAEDSEFASYEKAVREYGRRYQLTFHRAIDAAQALAITELQKQYNEDRYLVTGGIAYYQPAIPGGSEEVLKGVLDIVVFDKFTCQAVVIGKVRLSPVGARKALKQLLLFKQFLGNPRILEIGGNYKNKTSRVIRGEGRALPRMMPDSQRHEQTKYLRDVMKAHSNGDLEEVREKAEGLVRYDAKHSRVCRNILGKQKTARTK